MHATLQTHEFSRMCVCFVGVYISATCDNILPFLLVEIFMPNRHFSMQLKQTGSGFLSPFSRRIQPLGDLPVQDKALWVWPTPPLSPCSNICVFISGPDIHFPSISSLEVFIFNRQGTVSRELWYVNNCDPSQVSRSTHRGCVAWWSLKNRSWNGISHFGSSLDPGVFMDTNLHNKPPQLCLVLFERKIVTDCVINLNLNIVYLRIRISYIYTIYKSFKLY